MRERMVKTRYSASNWDMPLETHQKALEDELKGIYSVDKKYVFICPKCKKRFLYMQNYKEMKLCSKCFIESKTKELQEHVKFILGGTITDIKIMEVDSLASHHEPIITEIEIKTKDGQVVKLKKPSEVHFIL